MATSTQPGSSEVVRRLPLPLSGHICAVAIGEVADPVAVVLVGRRDPVSAAERKGLAAAIADHAAH